MYGLSFCLCALECAAPNPVNQVKIQFIPSNEATIVVLLIGKATLGDILLCGDVNSLTVKHIKQCLTCRTIRLNQHHLHLLFMEFEIGQVPNKLFLTIMPMIGQSAVFYIMNLMWACI